MARVPSIYPEHDIGRLMLFREDKGNTVQGDIIGYRDKDRVYRVQWHDDNRITWVPVISFRIINIVPKE